MHRLPRHGPWRFLVPVLAVMLLAGHVAILYQVFPNVHSLGIAAAAVVVLLVLKHLGRRRL